MPIIDITAAAPQQHPDLSDYFGLTDVALRSKLETERGLYMAESLTVLERAIGAGHQPKSVLTGPKWLARVLELLERTGQQNTPVYLGTEAALEDVTGFHVHRGSLAVMHRPGLPAVAEILAGARRVVVLENLVDHTNVGAIFRCAAALGVDGVLVTPRCADPLYRRSVRVAMGTVFQVPWTRLDSWPQGIAELHAAGFYTASLALSDDAISLDDFAKELPERVALIMGTEGDGLQAQTIAATNAVVKIPMSGGVDSLNVAAAAAVAIWAVRANN